MNRLGHETTLPLAKAAGTKTSFVLLSFQLNDKGAVEFAVKITMLTRRLVEPGQSCAGASSQA